MAGAPRTAAIVSIGNELLFGETVDTNAAWLGRTLGGIGIPVVCRFTVGDVAADILEALEGALTRADLVLTSGGLGPTPDDLTRGTVAERFGLGLVEDPGVLETLADRSRATGLDDVPERLRGQAEILEGATVLDNPDGTAPGLLLEEEGRTIVLLPGVPRELKGIVEGALLPRLRAALHTSGIEPVRHVVIHTTGLPESELTRRVEAALADLPSGRGTRVSLAYLPDLTGVDLRLSVRAPNEEAAEAQFRPLLERIEPVVAPFRFEAPSGDLAEAVSIRLRDAGMTIATAESCTGGMVASRLTDWPGASAVLLGGVVTYDNAAKVRHLGVRAADIDRHGAVSRTVAEQMAQGAARVFEADVGVGITGVAGPGGGSEDKPVGLVWIATSVRGEVESTEHRFAGDRAAVRARSAQAALAALWRRLRAGTRD